MSVAKKKRKRSKAMQWVNKQAFSLHIKIHWHRLNINFGTQDLMSKDTDLRKTAKSFKTTTLYFLILKLSWFCFAENQQLRIFGRINICFLAFKKMYQLRNKKSDKKAVVLCHKDSSPNVLMYHPGFKQFKQSETEILQIL